LLTGRRPSGTGEEIGPLAGDHLLEFGAGMRAVLARAMDDDPGRRYASALAFASALEAAARGGRVSEAITAVGAISGASRIHAPEPSRERKPDAEPRPSAGQHEEVSAELEDDLPLTTSAEPDSDDISAERDEDAAHFQMSRMPDVDDDREPTLFGDEADDDLLAAGAYAGATNSMSSASAAPRYAPEDGVGYRGAPSSRNVDASASPADVERPHPAALPIAVTLILGLLVGFAAGYWIGSRGPARTAVAPASTPASGAAAPAASTQSKPAGQPPGRQAVGDPSAVPPAIPDEGPAAAGRQPAPDAGARARASSAAATAATTGQLVVTSSPSRAAVTVDGRWRGRTPLTLNRLKLGKYSVRVVATGFAVTTEEVTLTGAAPSRRVAVRLARTTPSPRPPPARPATPARSAERTTPANAFAGSVYVDSRPRGARILIDGRAFGTTPARIPDVAIGSHVVRLELAEHRAWTVATRVAAGEETRVTGSLERIP
ncbi:MAG: PEGA domain-containing protein, partial [Acidobacteriota bacterium]